MDNAIIRGRKSETNFFVVFIWMLFEEFMVEEFTDIGSLFGVFL
jgi:hypothetical protein